MSHHPLATQAGIDVLQSGGNAFDAAVAIAATIAVVEPYASGPGGDAIFLLLDAKTGKKTAVMALGRSPWQASLGDFQGGIPHHGVRSATTPAAAAAWAHLCAHYATQPAAALFEAAVHYARDGFPATAALSARIKARRDALLDDPGCAAVFMPTGDVPNSGATIKNDSLARTLQELGDAGGYSAAADSMQRVMAFCQSNGGFLSVDDLAGVRAEERRPVSITYHAFNVLCPPPPSMGFTLLLELNILERFAIASTKHLSAHAIHLMVEAKKLAFAERETYGGDPELVEIPVHALLSKEFAADLARRLDPRRTTPVPSGTRRDGDTTYFAVVDAAGNAVSAIQSLGEAFGACTMDPATGILLNNRMAWFHLSAGHPNLLGPGRHVRHTMSPAFAFERGELRSAFGAPGGDGQYQAALQVFSAVADHGLDPQHAVDAPRWTHYQSSTGSVYPHENSDVLLLESRVEGHVLEELKRRGHKVATVGPFEDACMASIILRQPTGVLLCGADRRRDGWAGVI